MQAAAFWAITAEHCCVFEKLCKRFSVPKRNKTQDGGAHEVRVCKEKNPPQNETKEHC